MTNTRYADDDGIPYFRRDEAAYSVEWTRTFAEWLRVSAAWHMALHDLRTASRELHALAFLAPGQPPEPKPGVGPAALTRAVGAVASASHRLEDARARAAVLVPQLEAIIYRDPPVDLYAILDVEPAA